MQRALLVETVTGRTMADLISARDAAIDVDMVELRLDGVSDVSVSGALEGRTRPVIVTCRPRWEGGAFDGSEEDRHALLSDALDGGAEYVDVEWRAGFSDLIRRDPLRVVLSSHDFDGVPSDLSARATAMRRAGVGVIKIAVAVVRLADALQLLDIGRAGDAAVIAMGDAGVPSRLLATKFGSRWTYGGNAAAPGQIPASRMLGEFRFRDIGADTAVYGVVGSNVMQSLSPVMHNAAFAAARIDAVYVPLRAADIDDFMTFADAMGVAGASVTIPFKLGALDRATNADEQARAVGAANTLRRSLRGWEATNTDLQGFLDPLEKVYPSHLLGARAAVMGAGGAARAVAVALGSRGAHVTIYARRQKQADDVARACRVDAGTWPPRPGSWDLLVNCTPLGGPAARAQSPLPSGPFDGVLVYDLNYGDADTPLVAQARRAGCLTLGGLPMLIAQAERQFEWWTGERPASGVMTAAAYGRVRRTEPLPAPRE